MTPEQLALLLETHFNLEVKVYCNKESEQVSVYVQLVDNFGHVVLEGSECDYL